MYYSKPDDDYSNIYADILARLDDSQNYLRQEACKVLIAFFDCMPQWSASNVEYILKSAYIHLDDNLPEIRSSIKELLLVIFKYYKEQTIKIVHH
jgi:Cdc6-like AAA superfamily ATPase